MTPFEDTLPEEQEARYQELIELVQRVKHNTEASSAQVQIVERVRRRLTELEYMSDSIEDSELPLEDKNIQFAENKAPEAGETGQSLAEFRRIAEGDLYRNRKQRGLLILNTLAAVLVVSLLVGASFVLFGPSSHPFTSIKSTAGPVGTPVVARVESNGLEFSMSITPGPYFLGELLAIDMTLTNHSQTSYQMMGIKASTVCAPVLRASLTGGGSPHFTLLKGDIYNFMSCPHIGAISFIPGETISIQQHLPLTNSGRQTLSAVLWSDLNPNTSHPFNPFKDRPPSFNLDVQSTVPVDRSVLSLQQQGSMVEVISPSSLHLRFVYLYSVVCENAQGLEVATSGSNASWYAASANMIAKPECYAETLLPHEQWSLVVGAVGYELVKGDFSV